MRVKIIGNRTTERPNGLEHMQHLPELMNAFRGVDVLLPRGVYRFQSFEEADEWWEKNRIIRPRPPEILP